MALPVSVVMQSTGSNRLTDLSSLVAANSLTWSSVVPGGFASCSFTLEGDFRSLVRQVPFLAIVQVIGDSGRVLFEGQIEDLSPTLSDTSVGVKVGAYGFQNVLKETSVRAIWSKRDMQWDAGLLYPGLVLFGVTMDYTNFTTSTGKFDPLDLSKSGVQIASNGNGVSIPHDQGVGAAWQVPSGLSLLSWKGTGLTSGADSGSLKVTLWWFYQTSDGTWHEISGSDPTTPTAWTVDLSGVGAIALAAVGGNDSGSPAVLSPGNLMQFYDMRVLGVVAEDVTDGFYGDTLINSLLTSYVTELGQGVIESGSDFTIDHLDATVRRSAYDILTEITSYYAREWAVWEDALLHWRTPQLSEPGWLIPLNALSALDLDASVQNSQKQNIVLYTDAASGVTAEASASSTDRRNPYVLHGRVKDQLTTAGFAMTSNTAGQLASIILNNLGFGPVPAAGSITLPGDTLVSHTSQAGKKAWEIRAGDNVTIPELPMADIFTQDGRGETIFHVVSAEADAGSGSVTLTLDSYGSKRSDVLMARLAAVTQALTG